MRHHNDYYDFHFRYYSFLSKQIVRDKSTFVEWYRRRTVFPLSDHKVYLNDLILVGGHILYLFDTTLNGFDYILYRFDFMAYAFTHQ